MTLKKTSFAFRSSIILVGLIFIVWLVPFGSALAVSGPQKTIVSHFFPTGVRDTASERGNCWVTSLASPRKDAWRCMVQDTIYDPCFSAPSQDNYVICDANPAGDTRGLKVILSAPLPMSTATDEVVQPWMLRLSDGVVCTFLTGATSLVDNERVNYGCSDQSVIVGMPTEGKLWTVKEVLDNQKNSVTAIVADAWT